MPKKTRKYPTKHKTTTRQGKTEYMRKYMRDYRAYERALIRQAKKQFGTNLFNQRKRRKKR